MTHIGFERIEEMIQNMTLQSEKEIKETLNILYNNIHAYELDLYANDNYTEDKSDIIREWRRLIAKKVSMAKKQLEKTKKIDDKANNIKRNDQTDLEETVRLVSREVLKTNKNILTLEKSTLKLKGLNYTSKDLEREIEETKKMMEKDKIQEKKKFIT